MSTEPTPETPEVEADSTPTAEVPKTEAETPTTPSAAALSSQPAGRAAVDDSRRGGRVLMGIGLGVAFVAVVAFALIGYRTFNLRLEAARQVDRATNLIEQSDGIVVDVDEVVRAKVTAGLDEEANAALESVKDAQGLLDEAVELIDGAMPDLNDDERERTALLRDSATTRIKMLETSPALLEANAQAALALPLAADGWDALLDADKLSDQAVASYNKLTKAGVTKSRKLNREAAKSLEASQEKFEAAAEAFPAAGFADHLAYVEARIALNKLSQRSDAAWLDGKIEKANDLIAEYNKKDKRAVARAKDLTTPEALIAQTFEAETKELLAAYYAARDLALAADEALRTY